MPTAKPTIKPVLDLRRKLANGDYPVRVQLYHNGKQNFIAIKLRASKHLYDQSQAKRVNAPDAVELMENIQREVTKCHILVDSLPVFSITAFRKLYNSESGIRRKTTTTNLRDLYQDKIDRLESNNKFSTASNYKSSRNNILAFAKYINVSPDDLVLEDVTLDWLTSYDEWNRNVGNDNVPDPESKRTKKRSKWPSIKKNPIDFARTGNKPATVRCYLRCLRSIYNDAVQSHLISPGYYPFGNKRFKLGSPASKKNVLTREQLRILHDYDGKYSDDRDLWFALYYSNGMNTTDMLHLRKENIYIGAESQEFIRFIRRKTRDSSECGEIEVHVKPQAKLVFEKNMVKSNPYILNVLNDKMNDKQKHDTIAKYKGNVNQRLRTLGKQLGFHINLQMSRPRLPPK